MNIPSTTHQDRRTSNVGDPFRDLLSALPYGQRQGLVQRLATGYYEGWRPTRAEVADLIARETGQRRAPTPFNDARPAVRDQPIRTEAVTQVPQARDAGPGRDTAVSFRRKAFTVACGELLPKWDFVARGLSSGAWVQRAGRMCRLVSLQYELIPREAPLGEARELAVFTALITCLPDIPSPLEPGDGHVIAHEVRSGRVVGVRGHWAISPGVRQIRFLIYAQAPINDEFERHPSGALWVDLASGDAHWRRITDRPIGRYLATTRQETLREVRRDENPKNPVQEGVRDLAGQGRVS